jgi:uroporphyrinogen III methyltransferase/synthase
MQGKVWMVGAGPGDPELITVRGREALAAADVVLYDEAINPAVLDLAPESAETLYVGAETHLHPLAPAAVVKLLADRAAEGKQIVRLLGGDPFVFGGGVHEAEALAAAGTPFELVPGVTSTVAAPAYAGIPVVFPRYARSYAVTAGNPAGTAPESLVNWAALATAADTLVFTDAVSNLPAVTARLIEGGRAPETPAAVVQWGTYARQTTVVGTLADIAAKAGAAGLHRPAITVVGDVVRLREQLRWYDDRPLFGRQTLLARARRGASEIRRLLQAEGAEVIELPAAEVLEGGRPEIIGRVVEALVDGQYAWVIFTSERAVELTFRHLLSLGRDARALHATRVVAVGAETVETLAEHGIVADVAADQLDPDALVARISGGEMSRRRVLLPRADQTHRDLLQRLRRTGAEVEDVPLYVSSIPRQPGREALARLRGAEIDIVIFPAASAVASLMRSLEGALEPLARVTVACMTVAAADAARAAGLRVDVVAGSGTPAELVQALAGHFGVTGGAHRQSAIGGTPVGAGETP